jgi:UDP-GlcNAc:undecaprenyl-phosphate/decaprenyl-phosphate GlcNAc-1-phosphate transferase
MLNNFIDLFLIIKLPLLGLFSCFLILSLHWKSISNYFGLKSYEGVQRAHKYEVSRLGGFIIYLFFWVTYAFGYFEDKLFLSILISAIPFIFISLKEDLFHNTAPIIRLVLMIISCFTFFYTYPLDFPIIDIPLLGKVISFYPLTIIFFTFSTLVVMNGMNLIDGMNGLFGFTTLFQLICFYSLGLLLNDQFLIDISIIFLFPLLIFLIFNFPFGKIFIGDSGAYLYGFLLANLSIYLFGKYNSLLTWAAVLILFYPCMELLFSYIRKLRNKKSPLEADNSHLHSLIFKSLNKKFPYIKSNFLTTLIMCFFWIIPPFLTIFIIDSYLLIFMSLILLSIFYIILYKYLVNSLNID